MVFYFQMSLAIFERLKINFLNAWMSAMIATRNGYTAMS